ncbi:DUF3237 domain-containing protein [Metabacillus litoralis]|uniref:DUF3237 domain-containing protein n=1 Tax=Metabacillus litoralis TaxID=152268 RepID=UPI00203A5B02|nr:DUF3237 domain-containing protein [Metabacillus litoralis]MCM3160634.1 DUF3237 domain-containing protein [Metabacillus litoralis]
MESTFLFKANIQVANPIEVGDVGTGIRRVIPIIGGAFEGEGIKGKILSGGADYQMIRYDGVTEALAHYVIETDDGVPIYVINKGYRHGPKEIIDKIIRGEQVPDGSYYFKTTPTFETSSEKYSYLNRMIYIGEGLRGPNDVQISFYQVD